MRLVDYCDLGDAPEIRVQTVGSIMLVSPNIVRVTLVIRVPGRNEYVAAAHHVWDIADYLDAATAWREGRAAIEWARSEYRPFINVH